MIYRQLAGGDGVTPYRRIRHILALAAGIILTACLLAGAEARDETGPLDHHAAVLNGRLVGSAFLIGPDLALTNAHVVAGAGIGGEVRIYSQSRRVSGVARVLGVSPRMDLALLRMPIDFARVVPARDAPARAGLSVRGAGVDATGGPGLGPLMELSGNVIVDRADLGAYGPGMVVRMPGVRPGFSGGPVLDHDGRLVGMITAIRSSAGHSPASGQGRSGTGRPDEAFVLRAAEIRAEAERLLIAASN